MCKSQLSHFYETCPSCTGLVDRADPAAHWSKCAKPKAQKGGSNTETYRKLVENDQIPLENGNIRVVVHNIVVRDTFVSYEKPQTCTTRFANRR